MKSKLVLICLILGAPQVLLAADVPTVELTPAQAAEPKAADPFAFADFTWLNGNSRQTEFPLDSKYFTGEFTFDSNYVYDFANPADHTISGSTNTGLSNELQVEQLGVGGDFHYNNVRGRLMTQFGMYATMTPRNDLSSSLGAWNLSDAYRYVSEAYGGYHWDTWNGINVDVGIFMSYIGLESYYNFENWNYQMSYVSANTPWYFNGVRIQTYPNDKLKLEYWLINGWQSYGMFNQAPGLGMQTLWRPTGNWSFVSNEYFGHDTLGVPSRLRLHDDTSIQYKYLDNSKSTLRKAAFSITADVGCESGGGVSCLSAGTNGPAQYFIGIMAYNRFWLGEHYAVTIGGGAINNPGRYLVLLPPINGATASNYGNTPGTGSFTANPGDPFSAIDSSITWDYMPNQFVTFRVEYIHRQANVPYFAGSGGMTAAQSGNPGLGVPNAANLTPDLETAENRINVAFMVRL